jgi:hypothetical protein
MTPFSIEKAFIETSGNIAVFFGFLFKPLRQIPLGFWVLC